MRSKPPISPWPPIVAAAAIQEASLRAQIRATEQIIDAQEKSLRILRDQLRLGYVMRNDLAAQEKALAQVMTTLPPLGKQLEQTRDLIRALAGKLPNAEFGVFDFNDLRLPPEIPMSLPGKLIEQRPDVRAAAEQLHAAGADVGAAVASMLPQFTISGQYGGNATVVNQLFSTGGPFWNLYGGVTQPVFPRRDVAPPKARGERGVEAGRGAIPRRSDRGLPECRGHSTSDPIRRRSTRRRRRGRTGL